MTVKNKYEYIIFVRDWNLFEEFDCVQPTLEKPADPETDKRKFCPEDCNDVSYSTIIFGNPLDSASIASHLPSDWEDEKEKKLAAFQVVSFDKAIEMQEDVNGMNFTFTEECSFRSF